MNEVAVCRRQAAGGRGAMNAAIAAAPACNARSLCSYSGCDAGQACLHACGVVCWRKARCGVHVLIMSRLSLARMRLRAQVLGLACHYLDQQLLVLMADGQLRGYAISGSMGEVLSPMWALPVRERARRAAHF